MSKSSYKRLVSINQKENQEYIDRVVYKTNLLIEQKKKTSQKD